MATLTKSYEPRDVEGRWYDAWEAADCFSPRLAPGRQPYTIAIPPPNVTGVLTMGHVLNNTLQDILVRRARLDGRAALWIPGTDHAGIATQTVVERELRRQKINRRDLGRERFLEQVWRWREEKGGIILRQLRALGASCDWSRTQFTMDEHYSRAVLGVFVELFRKGHIHRGKRMVNWCPVSLTALSDEEVIMKPVKGSICTVRYERVDAPGEFITVKTTRPETIPGDVAIAVHPDDPRYAGWVGRIVRRPLGPAAGIPIIADTAIDREFGSGALKVTPAHDKVDFEIGQRHGLAPLDVLNADGTLNALAGPELAGMERFAARRKAAELLRESGALVQEEPHEHNVGYSERADVPIEPRLTAQWWLKYPRVEEAKAAVRDGHIRFHPERWSKVYLHWLENIQDWCISRQLWWGHRIPVWSKKVSLTEANWTDELLPWGWDSFVSGNRTDVSIRIVRSSDGREHDLDGDKLMPVVRETEGEYEIFASTLSSDAARELEEHGFKQDPDVLDTWASSWLWPFAILGWPDAARMKESGYDHFYPTSTLVTGPDIIFFWVARMIMAGLEFAPANTGSREDEKTTAGKPGLSVPSAHRPPSTRLSGDEIRRRVPFRDVYFTGIIRDAQGRKMSKSLGNSPDPLDLIAKYGADGLRFGIVSIAPQGQDIRFQEERIEGGKNFCNKLWNASRFRQMSGDMADNSSLAAVVGRLDAGKLDADDHAILDRLLATTRAVDQAFAAFEFSGAVQALYGFFWNDFCDWYVEVSKAKLQDPASRDNSLAIQDLVLRQTLLLLHPFTPFITEELWRLLGYGREGRFLMRDERVEDASQLAAALGARGIAVDRAAAATVEGLKELVSRLRALKAGQGEAARKDSRFVVEASDAAWAALDANLAKLLRMLGAAGIVRGPLEAGAPACVTPFGSWNLARQAGGTDAAAEKARLAKELEAVTRHIAATEGRIANPAFAAKAPPAVLEGARRQLAELQAKRAEVARLLAALG